MMILLQWRSLVVVKWRACFVHFDLIHLQEMTAQSSVCASRGHDDYAAWAQEKGHMETLQTGQYWMMAEKCQMNH
jgi:hypothetical protein